MPPVLVIRICTHAQGRSVPFDPNVPGHVKCWYSASAVSEDAAADALRDHVDAFHEVRA